MYQGLIRTCSHPIVVESEEQSTPSVNDHVTSATNEDEASQEQFKVTYRDYLPFWMFLLEMHKVKVAMSSIVAHVMSCSVMSCHVVEVSDNVFQELTGVRISLEQRGDMTSCVYDEIVRSVMAILDRLDLTSIELSAQSDDVRR